MNAYIEEVIAKVKARDAHEPSSSRPLKKFSPLSLPW